MSSWRQDHVERQRDEQVDRGPCQARAAPADRSLHQAGQWPPHRAGEAGDQGDSDDGRTRLAPVDRRQRGEGALVEPDSHSKPDDRPGREERLRALRHAQGCEPHGEDEIGCRENASAAKPVDAAPAPGSDHGRDHEREGKGREEPGRLQAQILGDRRRQHRGQVIGGAEGDRLLGAERDDDTADIRWPEHQRRRASMNGIRSMPHYGRSAPLRSIAGRACPAALRRPAAPRIAARTRHARPPADRPSSARESKPTPLWVPTRPSRSGR